MLASAPGPQPTYAGARPDIAPEIAPGIAPGIAVVIPCHEAAATIERAIASARAQTYPWLDIVVVDDGSGAETRAVLRRLAGDGVRVLRLPRNHGVSVARNLGVAATTAPTIAFLDADDVWHPRKLAVQMASLAAQPEASFVGCMVEEVALDGAVRLVNARRNAPSGPDAWRALLEYSYYVPTAMLIPREAFVAAGGFDPRLPSAEDQDLAIRLARLGPVACVRAVLATKHERPDSLSRAWHPREAETVLPMIAGHLASLGAGLTPEDRRRVLGIRLSHVGRNAMRTRPLTGALLLARGAWLGYQPWANARALLGGLPGVRALRQAWAASARAERPRSRRSPAT